MSSSKAGDLRVRRIFENTYDYIGMENDEGRWVMQEWRCTFCSPTKP